MPETKVEHTYYRNGQIRQELPYCDGQLHGTVRTWHKNEQISLETTIAEGEFKGRTRTWLRDGTLVFEESLSEGDTIRNRKSGPDVLVDVGAAKSGSARRGVASKKAPDLDSKEHELF